MRDLMGMLLRKLWTIAAIVVAVALFAAACSNAFYEITSPSFLSFHVILRKAYSIGAFTLVGFLFRRAKIENGGRDVIAWTILATAGYSAGIEVGQFFSGSKEGLAWNVFDTLCGAAGGALAMSDAIVRRIGARRKV